MSILSVEGLSHAFGDNDLYLDASFELFKGEHMGVVGQNGTGKSTLINILMGKISPNAGRIVWQNNLTIGHIDQYAMVDGALTIEEYLHTAFAELYSLEKKLNDLYSSLSSDADQRTLNRAAAWQQRLDQEGFYNLDQQVQRVAAGLGLDAIGLSRTLDTLSGGQRAKAILGKLLLGRPQILLLDEPTNFLDAEHVAWLSGYLGAFEGAFIIVSHDFDFLDSITGCILDIEFRQMKKYYGRYSDFVRQKTFQREEYLRQYRAQQREVEKLEDYIARNKARASTARMAQSRQKKLDKIDRLAPPNVQGKPRIGFQSLPLSASWPLQVQNLRIGYQYPLLPGISFKIASGHKVAVSGFNGIGKTTLFRTLCGEIPALGGQFAFDPTVKLGYFQQDMAWPDASLTPLQIVAQAHPGMPPKQLRRELARCGVKAEHMMQPVRTLSGGEQNKVKLCLVTTRPYNMLFLDEPTNHLDAETKAALADAIRAFSGSVLLVSHEAAFYRDWIDRVIDIEALI